MSGALPAGAPAAELAGGAPLLELTDVAVRFATGGGAVDAVRSVNLQLAAGEVLAVVGESGSGKSVTAMSLLGLLPRTAAVSGRAVLAGRDLYGLTAEELRRVRGNEIGMIFQEPMSALNPVLRIDDQLIEAIRVHRDLGRAQARDRATELLRLVELPDPARVLRSYPHELSGGQLQRVVIAMAVANEPKLLIADEPTTALDVTVQAEILELLRDLRSRLDTAILLITHDMGVVADLADRVVVMHDGEVIEQGDVHTIFNAPSQEYTRDLLGSVIALSAQPMEIDTVESAAEPVLRVRDLSVVYGKVRAADGVSFDIAPGEILGLVGESGSGKSTVAGAVTGLVKPTAGAVHFDGSDMNRADKALRRRIGVVFQDPASALNPRATIGDSIAEPLRLHRVLSGSALEDRVADLLRSVQLDPALGRRYPHELSGGQRQRACIARALALDPDLLVADEPTSALDVSVQARVLELILRLQDELGFACLFISHDLAVIERLANRVVVMHHGRIVETGPTASVLYAPQDAYTRRLIAAAPVADPVVQAARRQAWRAL
ncbi:ABC transporter ATP-binding protein [Pseudonocardiaceae bacterium YIM PH 21723]|nr:ABC transporter ATP-binding protein [Pseudonocardiaceae bacterium YIM PH 21723]